MILIGALLWLAGLYPIPLVAPFLLTIGFGVVCTSAAITSLQRPTENAAFGLLLGGIIQVIGYYLLYIPLIGWLIAPFPIVLGSVLIIYFAIPLAIKTGKVPFVEEIQKKIRKDKDGIEPVSDSEDTSDQDNPSS